MPTAFRFPYSRSSNIYLPLFYKFKNLALIKVGLCRDCRVTKPQSFIDTGAQYCMFNNAYAKYLGIDDFRKVPRDRKIYLTGIGGQKDENVAYFHTVDLYIYLDQKHLDLKNALQIVETKIGFLERPIDVAGILGVYGFLDHFSFYANIPKGYFEIEALFG